MAYIAIPDDTNFLIYRKRQTLYNLDTREAKIKYYDYKKITLL